MRKRYVQTKRKMALREMENTSSKKKKKPSSPAPF